MKLRSSQEFLSYDIEQAVEMRMLSDGRRLALFPLPDEMRTRTTHEKREVAPGRFMSVPVLRQNNRKQSGFVLAINDDQTSLFWRRLRNCKTEAIAREVFRDFQEGDDDRRSGKARRKEKRGGRRTSDRLK